jgi:hypothetical protein
MADRRVHLRGTQCPSAWGNAQAYQTRRQTGGLWGHASERLSLRSTVGRLPMRVMVANRTREIRPSGMIRGACGDVGKMGAGLRPIGKPMDKPPYPKKLRALHFYPNRR